MTESELRDQVRQMKTDVLSAMQTSGDIAQMIGDWELLTGSWRNFDAYLHRLDEVTPEEVRQAMNRYAQHVDFALLGKVSEVDPKPLESF